jgi:hypothetical protein
LEETVKDHERMFKKHEWNMQDIWDTMKKTKLKNHGCRRRRGDINKRH